MKKIVISALIIIALILGGKTLLDKQNMTSQAGPPGGGMDGMQGPMPVEVIIIEPEEIQIWTKFPGQLVAVDRAQIRPQVTGRITEIHFNDGEHVDKGDLLFIIDPRPYEATLAQAKAALAAAITQRELAEKEFKRAEQLIKTEAISQRILDERTNARRIAVATLQGARATVKSAQINLDYAYVKAPISGTAGRAEITVGNLVESGPNAPLLTTIVSDAEIYADFEIDDQTYIRSVRNQSDNLNDNLPVHLSLLGDERLYEGTVQSFDNRIDPATGTVRVRALFENEDGALLNGMSIDVLMGNSKPEPKIMLSERAISTDQDRKFVYIVDEQNTATYREVKIGQSINGKRIILSGLNEGDKVITEGIVRIRPGMPVQPQTAAEKESALEKQEQKQEQKQEMGKTPTTQQIIEIKEAPTEPVENILDTAPTETEAKTEE